MVIKEAYASRVGCYSPESRGTESLRCQVSVLCLVKLFLINRLRSIVPIGKEELSTQSFNNNRELLTSSL